MLLNGIAPDSVGIRHQDSVAIQAPTKAGLSIFLGATSSKETLLKLAPVL